MGHLYHGYVSHNQRVYGKRRSNESNIVEWDKSSLPRLHKWLPLHLLTPHTSAWCNLNFSFGRIPHPPRSLKITKPSLISYILHTIFLYIIIYIEIYILYVLYIYTYILYDICVTVNTCRYGQSLDIPRFCPVLRIQPPHQCRAPALIQSPRTSNGTIW